MPELRAIQMSDVMEAPLPQTGWKSKKPPQGMVRINTDLEETMDDACWSLHILFLLILFIYLRLSCSTKIFVWSSKRL